MHDKRDYNSRLFESNAIRRSYHMSRFLWVRHAVREKKIDTSRFLELGCFDGRLLDFVPPPMRYVGVDGNWEGGLDIAKVRFAGDTTKEFLESVSPETLKRFEDGQFSTFAALETLEHIPPDMLDAYLDEVSRVLKGDLLVTVPNEKGPILLAKQVAKKIIRSRSEPYNFSELVNAALGRMHKVERDEHKGFDYADLVKRLSSRFQIVSVTGLPFRALPCLFNLTVAIHARSIG